MEATIQTIFGTIFSKLLEGDSNNNNGIDQAFDNIRNEFDQKIAQERLETDEKINIVAEKSANWIRQIQEESKMESYNNNRKIDELINNYEEFKRESKARDKELDRRYNDLENKFNERLDKKEKEIEQKVLMSLGKQQKNEQYKKENDNLEKDNIFYINKGIEKEREYERLLLEKEKKYKANLDSQKLMIDEISKKDQDLSLEIENKKEINKIEIEKISKKTKEEIEKMNEEYNKIEKEKKEQEDKKQKEEKIQQQKDENNKILSEKLFKEKSKIKKKEFIEKLKNTILSRNFFEEILNKYNTEEIHKIIEEINTKINLKDVFDEKTKQFLNLVETIKINPDTNHLNILLLGPTGSGKSTLINVLLELEGEERAEVGEDNNPKTMDFHAYTSNKKKYIRCYDSRGIEKDKNYSLDKFIENSKNFILKKLKADNPDEFIHIILYCFEGERFVEDVRESLYKLMDLYNDDTLPIILVHTRGVQGEEDENLFNVIKKTLKKEKRKIDLINICAEQDDYFPPFGIDELYKLIVSKVKESVKSACFSSVQNKVKDNFIKMNIEYKNNFKDEFEKIIVKIMKDIKLNSNISEQKKLYLKIFMNDVFEKILFDKKKKLDENCRNILKQYLDNFFKWIMAKSEEYMINFISQNSYELISELLNIQYTINSKFDNKLQAQKNNEEWKEELDKKLKKELDNVILFKLMKEGSIFIYEEFNKIMLDLLEKKYKEYLQEENEFITKVTKGKVEEILNNFVFN